MLWPDEKLRQLLGTIPPQVIKSRKVGLEELADRVRKVDASVVSDEAISDFVRKMRESSAILSSKIKPGRFDQFEQIVTDRAAALE